MKKGRIVQVMGPVVDVEFENGGLPYIKEALEVMNGGTRCVMEVAQHIGHNTVRCVMLASSEEDSVEDIASMRAADFSEQPDEAYIQKEGSNAIEQMIRSLKEPYREVCILRFLEEKDTQEIAQILGRPKKTVETQLYRARAILQKQIKEVYSYEKNR